MTGAYVGKRRAPGNPLSHIPANARRVAYIVYAMLGPVLMYTASRGWTGDAEYTLYIGLGTALGLTAASNITEVTPETVVVPDDGERVTLTEDEVTRGVSIYRSDDS